MSRVKPEQVSASRSALSRQTVAVSASFRSAAPLPATTRPVPPSDARDPRLGLLIETIADILIPVFSARPPDQALILWTAEWCGAMLALGAARPEMLDTLLPTRLDALTGCLN